MEFLGNILGNIFDSDDSDDSDQRNRRGRYNNYGDQHGDHGDEHHRYQNDRYYNNQRRGQCYDSRDAAIGSMTAPCCHKCGRTEKPGTRFCGNCGNQLDGVGMEARRCPHCTSRLTETDRFCTSCGATC